VEDIIIPLAGMATGLLLLFPLVRVTVRLVERKWLSPPEGADTAALEAEIERLRERVAGTEDLAYRIVELEERTDFTERVLTRPQRDGLPSPE
jgi:hypothetical protein